MALFKAKEFLTAEADSHGGHKLGLCNPDVVILTAEGHKETPDLRVYQQYIWELRTEHLNSIVALTGHHPNHHFHVGDICQGDKYKDGLMVMTQSDQVEIAAANMLPAIDQRNVRKCRIFAGTSAHDYGESSAEIQVVRRLQSEFKRKDIGIAAHSRSTIGGEIFDAAHHGPSPGTYIWTEGNVARAYLRNRMFEDLQLGKRPAKVYLRGHFHKYLKVSYELKWAGVWYESHLFILPSWCGANGHARQSTRSAPTITNGMLVFEMRKGELFDVHKFLRTEDLRTEEVL